MRGMTNRSRRGVSRPGVVRHGTKRAPLSAHFTYLRRDGVTKDGDPARMFGAGSDDVDHKAFAERCGRTGIISGSLSHPKTRANFPI